MRGIDTISRGNNAHKSDHEVFLFRSYSPYTGTVYVITTGPFTACDLLADAYPNYPLADLRRNLQRLDHDWLNSLTQASLLLKWAPYFKVITSLEAVDICLSHQFI